MLGLELPTGAWLPWMPLSAAHSQVLNEGEGNVHSGATPPWMRDDSGVNESAEASIGPSLDNFLKHSESMELSFTPQSR